MHHCLCNNGLGHSPGTASRGGHIVVDLLDDDDDDDDTADGAPMNIFERFVANGDDHDDDDDDAAVIDSDAQIIVPVQDVLKARDIDEGVARLNAAWRGVWPVAPGDLYPFDEYATVAFVRAVRRIQDIRYGDDAIVRDIPSDLMGHVPLKKKSFMNVLRTDEWLNDEVIDAFGALLQHHYKNTMYATLVLPSYIWKDQGQSTNLRRYIQKATPFLRDFPESSVILAPIHHNLHWALLAIFADKGKAVFYNSMSAGWSTFAGKQQQLIFKDLLQLLVPLFPALEPRANRRRVTPDDVRLPQQRDGASCGLYVMHAMHCLAVSVHETAFAPSTWEHKLPYIRMHLALSLWLASPPLLFDEEAYVLY